MKINIPAAIKSQLQMAMLDESELVSALSEVRPEKTDDPPGGLRFRPQVPVRRAWDPEYAEVRELEVVVVPRPDGDAWEVRTVVGLELDDMAE